MLKRLLALFLLSALVGACVSTPKSLELSEPPASLPSEHPNGLAEVYVVRPGIMGFAVTFGIEINGENVGGIRSNDYVRKCVPAGTVHVKAASEADCEATFPVLANQAYYLKATAEMGWWIARVQLHVMDPEDGRKAVEKSEDQTRASAKTPTP